MSTYPRTNYEMSEEDLAALLAACKPVPAMMVGGVAPQSPQQNANDAWAALGRRMGFDGSTVRPVEGMGGRFFTAVPSETPEARKEREERETSERRNAEIERLKSEIAELMAKLDEAMQS